MRTRKNRSVLGKEWSSLRMEIANVIREKGIKEEDFHSLSIHENWKNIEEKIYQTFCQLSHPTQRPAWLWSNLKHDYYIISDLKERPETYLHHLVDKDEIVWYFANETINEGEKFWFYEGKVEAIQIIIDETWFDELFLVSKKYKWLICINHHDALIATGNEMTTKMKLLDSKNA